MPESSSNQAHMRGRVTQVVGNQVWVDLATPDAGCGRCYEPGGCRAGLERAAAPAGRKRVFHYQGEPLIVGQMVRITVDARAPLLAAILLYGGAVLGLILGAGVGLQIDSEWGSVLGGMFGMILVYLLVRVWSQSAKQRSFFQMTLRPERPSVCEKTTISEM